MPEGRLKVQSSLSNEHGTHGRARSLVSVTGLRIAVVALVFVLAACSSGGASGGVVDARQVDLGMELYGRQCQSCHGDAATGANALPGAPAAPVHGPSGHTWHHPDGMLVGIVLGSYDYPGRAMPSFEGSLSEEEVRIILAYIKTSWTSSQRARQAEVSESWRQARESG